MTSFNIIHSTTNFAEWSSERQSQSRKNLFKKANPQLSAELGGRGPWMFRKSLYTNRCIFQNSEERKYLPVMRSLDNIKVPQSPVI